MRERPLSVTIIAWLIIASGLLSARELFVPGTPVERMLMAETILPGTAQWTLSAVGVLVSILCGAFMLRGHEWSRLLYVGWNSIGLMIGALVAPWPSMLLISALLLTVIAFFLFRGPANRYFGRSWLGDEEPARP